MLRVGEELRTLQQALAEVLVAGTVGPEQRVEPPHLLASDLRERYLGRPGIGLRVA